MATKAVLTFPAASTTAVCLGQNRTGAGALVLDGTGITYPYMTRAGKPYVEFANVERPVTLTVAATNLSGVNFLIVGEDLLGAVVSESKSGPSSNTVSTTALYHRVYSITSDASVTGTMSVGSGTTGRTTWWKIDRWATPTNIAMSAAITATLNFTGQYTYDNVETVASPVAITIPSMSAITASAEAAIDNPVDSIRGVINSSSGSGAVTVTLIQALPGVS